MTVMNDGDDDDGPVADIDYYSILIIFVAVHVVPYQDLVWWSVIKWSHDEKQNFQSNNSWPALISLYHSDL